MTDPISLLSKVSSSDIQLEPYPHIVIKNALPSDYYANLEQSFPGIDQLKSIMQEASAAEPNNKSYKRTLRHLGRRNKRVNIPSSLVVDSPSYSPSHDHSHSLTNTWQRFIDYHSSDQFFKEMLQLFEAAIQQRFPELNTHDATAKRRNSVQDGNFSVDAMVAINTPSWFRGKITGPHTDHPNKLFIGLFYMQHEEDMGGGNLKIYQRKVPVNDKNLKWPPESTVEEISTINYDKNTFVLLLNTPESVHGVTTRYRSKFPRRFVNIIAERDHPFF